MEPSPQRTSLEHEYELFQRFKADPTAIGELYDQHADKLYGFLLKRCGHKELAEDLVSQTFIRLMESRLTLEWKNVPLSAWMFQVATNALVDHYRKASTRRDTQLDADEWDPPSADDPAWNAELVLTGEQLRMAMKELSERDQQVLTLKFYAELETNEVATLLGIEPNHAAVLIYRALGRLRNTCIFAGKTV